MSCHVFLAGETLAIQAPYYMKDVCKSIPGARWKPDLKMWTYPATPSAAPVAAPAEETTAQRALAFVKTPAGIAVVLVASFLVFRAVRRG